MSVTGCVRQVVATPTPLPARAIKIAVLVRDGDFNAPSMKNSATLAVEEWNKIGGVRGKHPLEVKFYEEGTTAETGVAAVKQAIADGSDMIVGGSIAGAGPAYVEAAVDANKFIFLTTIGPRDGLAKWEKQWDRYKTYFHMDPMGGFDLPKEEERSFTPPLGEPMLAVEMGALFTYMRTHWGFERIAFVYEKDPLFSKIVPLFEAAAKKRGLTITATEVIDAKTDFDALWTKLRASKTQVVRYLMRDSGVAFAKAYGKAKPPILAFGVIDGGTTKDFWKATGGACEGMVVHHKGGADVPMHYRSSWWQEMYKKRFDNYPTMASDDVYVAIHGFAQALDQVDTLEPSLVAATLERLSFAVGPGFFGWYHHSFGSCHIRAGDKLRAVWDSQWHANAELAPVWSPVFPGEQAGFPLAQRYVIEENIKFPNGLKPVRPKGKH